MVSLFILFILNLFCSSHCVLAVALPLRCLKGTGGAMSLTDITPDMCSCRCLHQDCNLHNCFMCTKPPCGILLSFSRCLQGKHPTVCCTEGAYLCTPHCGFLNNIFSMYAYLLRGDQVVRIMKC